MATPYVPGPSNWYVSTGVGGAYEYLGMCEGETRLGLAPEWEPIFADGAGGSIPFDMQFMGCRGSVSGDLIYFNEPVLNRLKNWLNDPAAVPGTFANGTVGTLVRTENKAFSLVIVSTYRTKSVFQNAGMNGAWQFPFAVPVGSWDTSLSSRTKRERLAFDCLPVWNLLGGGTLYSNNISGLSLPNPG